MTITVLRYCEVSHLWQNFFAFLQQSVLKAYSHLLKVETSRFRSSPTISLASKGTYISLYMSRNITGEKRNLKGSFCTNKVEQTGLANLVSCDSVNCTTSKYIYYLNKLCLEGLINQNLSYFRPVISEIFYLLADFFFKNKEFRYLSRWFSVISPFTLLRTLRWVLRRALKAMQISLS